MKQIKWLTGIFLPALCMAMLLFACENDLKKVQQISAQEVNKPVDTTKGVDVVYSDSAKVKSRILTPLMLSYTVAKPYREMPNGVKIIFYDDKMNLNAKTFSADKHIIFIITAGYAVTSNDNNLIELRKNVVITNPVGDVFKTEQLFYDVTKKTIYSKVDCLLTKKDGTVLDGTGFTSNDTFTQYHFDHGKGSVHVEGNLAE